MDDSIFASSGADMNLESKGGGDTLFGDRGDDSKLRSGLADDRLESRTGDDESFWGGHKAMTVSSVAKATTGVWSVAPELTSFAAALVPTSWAVLRTMTAFMVNPETICCVAAEITTC